MTALARRALRAHLALAALAVQPLAAQLTPASRAVALDSAAAGERRLGSIENLARAIDLWRQAGALYQRAGDRVSQAATLRRIGDTRRDTGWPDTAMLYYTRALQVSRSAGDALGEARALNGIGSAHGIRGQADSSAAYFRRALGAFRTAGSRVDEGRALFNLGIAEWYRANLDTALAHYRGALAIFREVGDPSLEGLALAETGRAHLFQSRPDSARVYLLASLQRRRALGERFGEGFVLTLLGQLHAGFGRADSAVSYYTEALEVRSAVGDREGVADLLSSLAELQQFLGRPDSAVSLYGRVRDAGRETGNRSREAVAMGMMGTALREAGRPQEGLEQLRLSLAILREIGSLALEGRTVADLGEAFAALGQADSAAAYQRRALEMHRARGDRAAEAATLHNVGSLFHRAGQADSALAYYSAGLRIHRELGAADRIAVSLHDRGVALYRSGQLAGAVAHYDTAASLLAELATHVSSDADRVSLAELRATYFGDWALAWLARALEVGERAAALASLAAAERGRAQGLRELLRGGAAPPAPGADLVAEGERIAAAAARSGATTVAYALTADTLIAWVIRPNGAVQVVRQAVPRDSVAALVAELRGELGADGAATRAPGDSSFVLAALEGDRGLRVRARCASDERGLGVVGTCCPEDGRGLRVRGRRCDPAGGAGDRLSRLLLPSDLPRRGALVVVPSGVLGLVPFAALPHPRADRPLGTVRPLRYAPSLEVLAEVEARPDPLADPAALAAALVLANPQMPALGDPVTGRPRPLAPLPGAEREGRWLGERLRARVLAGSEATETALRTALQDAPLVHLATHGYAYASEARARDSFLALAPEAGSDGFLTVGRVVDEYPRIGAGLVVLSACQSGLGKLAEAEGTLGFQRAFLAKGARSVLVSLWSVSDRATELLMQRFYTHWLDDRDRPDRAEALRRAQADVRATRGLESPVHWAAFQLVGAP